MLRATKQTAIVASRKETQAPLPAEAKMAGNKRAGAAVGARLEMDCANVSIGES